MKCERCGVPFEGKRRDARFCSRNCKCRSKDRRLKNNTKKWRKKIALDPSYDRERLWQRYGISSDFTYEDYVVLFSAQGGLCAICKKPPMKKTLAADHDHKTGKVRGLLCTRCNLLLGRVEAGSFLQSALDYLILYRSKAT